MPNSRKACPFVSRECLEEDCMAWRGGYCRLIIQAGCMSPFENELVEYGPLMYRSLIESVKIMEDEFSECPKCGPDLWNHAQQIRVSLLDHLIAAELAEAGIKAEKYENSEPK